MDENIDRDYCIHQCPIGCQKSAEFLKNNNSPYDAALDMHWFVEKCSKTCERFNSAKA